MNVRIILTFPIFNNSLKYVSTGTVEENNDSTIELRNIQIVTPTGDVIVPDLDLYMKPGTHLLITGICGY
jgi:ABC-type uncharacterized transport system fused permease/ATPase subunit